MHANITEASDIVPRGEAVVLKGLRTKGGGVTVWVEPLDALDSARVLKAWVGLQPQVGPAEERSVDVEEKIQNISRPLIEKCVRVMRDGALVQAFSWSGESVLPPNHLTAEDIGALTAAAARLSGLLPEGEQGAGFPDEQPAGVGDGGGTVLDGEGLRADAVGGG